MPPIRSVPSAIKSASPMPVAPRPPSPNGDSSSVAWVERTVQVNTDEEDRKPIQARCYGGVAVHPATDQRKQGRWTVTAVACGLAFCELPSEEEGRKVGETAWEFATLALREVDREAVMARLPRWFVSWSKSCAAEGRCVDHRPFVREAK